MKNKDEKLRIFDITTGEIEEMTVEEFLKKYGV